MGHNGEPDGRIYWAKEAILNGQEVTDLLLAIDGDRVLHGYYTAATGQKVPVPVGWTVANEGVANGEPGKNGWRPPRPRYRVQGPPPPLVPAYSYEGGVEAGVSKTLAGLLAKANVKPSTILGAQATQAVFDEASNIVGHDKSIGGPSLLDTFAVSDQYGVKTYKGQVYTFIGGELPGPRPELSPDEGRKPPGVTPTQPPTIMSRGLDWGLAEDTEERNTS